MVSAVKVGGRRLHELARQGIEVERAARTVTVSRFDTAPDPERPGVYRAEVVCSSGTYIRVLADDLGRALGGGAHVANLRRTRIGSFGEADMHQLDAIGPDAGPHAGPGHARPRRRDGGRRRRRRHPHRAARSTGSPSGRSATAPGPCSTRRGSCWPSTRRPAATASGRPWCWPGRR